MAASDATQALPSEISELKIRSIAADFIDFQGRFPLQKVHLPRTELEWTFFQAPSANKAGSSSGPPSSGNADVIIFLHGTSGVAAAFFYQVEAIASKGYKAYSAQYPAYYSAEDWCRGFDHFLDQIKCRAAHVFGAGIGGFLAQHFAERYPQRVKSIMLCNSFGTTYPFAAKAGALATVVHVTPTPLLRKVMLDSFPQGGMDLPTKQAIDWVAQQVNDLSGDDLASRLTLNCTASAVCDMRLEQSHVTILESNGDTMVPEEVRRDLKNRYPSARVAQLKALGDFPYLSCPAEVTLFIEVHLRKVGAVNREIEVPADILEEVEARFNKTREEANPIAYNDDSRSEWQTDSSDAAPTPSRRPKWVNPFEDDDLL